MPANLCARSSFTPGMMLGLMFAVLLLVLFAEPSVAQGREALLMQGKSTLYQRVLTRPGAVVRVVPGGRIMPHGHLPPLSVLFVFERRTIDDEEWLEIGYASQGEAYGWLPSSKAIDWKQTLTVAFTQTVAREPTLFFRARETLVEIMESENLVRDIDRFRHLIKRGEIPPEFPVISIEPATYVDPNRHFYLLPILGFDEVYLESGHIARVLNVAAVTLHEGDEDLLEEGDFIPTPPSRETMLRDYRTGVVFVIDSTSSMGPYIDRTREAIRHIYQRLKDSPQGDNLSFGLIAYRDNPEVAEGLEYVSRVFATLADGRNEEAFFDKVEQVEAAAVPSKGFNEDAYAGIFDAIESIDWRGYDGRFIILISDAGARDAKDPLGRTKLGAERLRLLAQDKDQAAAGSKIAIYTLHLLTREGRHTHDRASVQYRMLSQWGEGNSLYFPVDDGSVESFGEQVDELTRSLVQQLEIAHTGRLIDVPSGPDVTEIERKTALVGRAMQLAYLGRVKGSAAPRLINAWVADRDFVNQSQKGLEVRALITKNQLSDLQETLQAILVAGERTFMSAKDFFTQLRSAAATLTRAPNKVNQIQVRKLADVGLVGEWLSDLPYKSSVMNITESRWLKFSYARQQEMLDAIEEKILLYRQIHDDTDRWIQLSEDAVMGEAVTTIPLDALP